MPFTDFNKEPDDSDRRTRTVLIALFALLPIGFWTFNFFSAFPSPRETRSHGINLNFEEEKRRLDETCESLPKPEGFSFAEKTAPATYSRHISVGYLFRSQRSKEEIYPTFIVWFSANGWTAKKTSNEDLEFGKGNRTISIAYTPTVEGVFYGIKCSEWIKE